LSYIGQGLNGYFYAARTDLSRNPRPADSFSTNSMGKAFTLTGQVASPTRPPLLG